CVHRIAWLVALCFPRLALAQEPASLADGLRNLPAWAQVSGSLRAGYWSASRSLNDSTHLATAALWLKAEPRLGRHMALTGEGWLRNEALFQADETSGELREAYLDVSVGAVDLRLGKQLIVWGRADRLNPTDNLTPRNFTLLVPEDDDQRLGVP